MKLILIDGGPASGKSTLGQMLVERFKKQGENFVLLDLDSYVEKYCPTWKWNSDQQKEGDLLKAREDFTNAINKSLGENFVVIAIGDRFMTKNNIEGYTNKLLKKVPIYLYHLSAPYSLREQRFHERGPHSLIDLEKDQKDRDSVKEWPGYVYQNINSPEVDAMELQKLIQANKGLIDTI